MSDGLRLERARASAQFADGKFRNPSGLTASLQNPLPLFGEYFFGGGQRTPPGPLPVHDPRDAWSKPQDTAAPLRATWLGHSTVLLEFDGVRVLTDPVFGDRASPLSFAGPKRFHPVPAKIESLPPLDLVLLSHDHYDHLCKSSMVELAKRGVPIVTALGVGAHLESYGIPAAQIHELDWHESITVGAVKLTATPSQHFSGRSLGDRNRTLWASWVIEANRQRVFFSGDTGFFDGFAAIGKQYGPFDLTMLEIGAYHPNWGHIHLGPEKAFEAFQLLGGGTLLPVHWGTFNLALHEWHQPAETLMALANANHQRVLFQQLGQVFSPSLIDTQRQHAWWRDVVKQPFCAPTPIATPTP